MKIATAALICSAMLASFPIGVMAQPEHAAGARSNGSFHETVSLAGIDLNTPEGARRALRVITSAATNVCGGEPDIFPLAPQVAFARCRSAAVESAVERLGAPRVTALLLPQAKLRVAGGGRQAN